MRVCAEPALKENFEPLQHVNQPGPQCSAFICHREQHCPSLRIRPARWSNAQPQALVDIIITQVWLVCRKVFVRREVTLVYVREGKTETGGITWLNVQKRKHAGKCAPTQPSLAAAAAPEPRPVPDGDPIVCGRRVEDHGGIMSLLEEPTNPHLSELLSGPALREELAGAPQGQNHTAVCEVCPDV